MSPMYYFPVAIFNAPSCHANSITRVLRGTNIATVDWNYFAIEKFLRKFITIISTT